MRICRLDAGQVQFKLFALAEDKLIIELKLVDDQGLLEHMYVYMYVLYSMYCTYISPGLGASCHTTRHFPPNQAKSWRMKT